MAQGIAAEGADLVVEHSAGKTAATERSIPPRRTVCLATLPGGRRWSSLR
jgi:hypothetical protein